MSHAFHKFWLKITALVVGSFGPIFFLGTLPDTLEPARFTLDILDWPLDGATSYASADTRFLSALTGGFLVGWGVTLWSLSSWAYDLAPEAVRKSVVSGALAWFLLDSAGSVAAGAPSNVLFNCLFLMLAIWELGLNSSVVLGA